MSARQLLVIFGGSSAIAREIATQATIDFEVVLISRKNIDLENIKVLKVENYSEAELANLYGLIANHGTVTFIFLNGIAETSAFYRLSTPDITDILEVNLGLPIRITNLLLKKYLNKKLNFVYSSSSRALAGDVGISVYSASKAGLVSFAKCMALEYGRLQHQFVVLSLGLFDSGLNDSLTDVKRKEIFSRSATPNFVNPHDLWVTLKFIIGNRSINGSALKVDNGYF
jgi:3-oxoacyl-[acyl-carrier protein] reductase